MTKPIDTSKYFAMLKPFEAKPGYYMLSSAVLRSHLELAVQEGISLGVDIGGEKAFEIIRTLVAKHGKLAQ